VNTTKHLFKNTIALTIASAGQLVGNMILFFYLSRLLQAEGLGVFSTVLAIFQTASLGCGIGFTSFLPRELPKDLSQTNRYLIHSSLVSITTAIILIVILFLLTPYLGYLPQTQNGLFIISFALIPESIQVVLNAIFIAHQRAEFITVTGLVSVFGRIIVSLLSLYFGFGVIGLIVVYTIFSFLSMFMNLFFLKKFIVIPQWIFDRSFLWNMLRELKVFSALALLNGLCSQSEILILSLTRGETQVGYYSAALKLVTIWVMIPSSYLTALFPVLSTTIRESAQKVVILQNRSLKYLLAAAFPLAVGMTILAGEIIPLFYTPEFRDSIGTLRILAWYLPLIFCNSLLWRVLFIRNEQGVVFRWQFITEIIQVLLALLLTPKYGSIGAAIAVFGGNLAYSAYFVYFLKNVKTPLPLFQISWRFIVASIVMGIFTLICSPTLQLLILFPAAALIYGLALWVLRAFDSDDIKMLKEILHISKKPSYQVGSGLDQR